MIEITLAFGTLFNTKNVRLLVEIVEAYPHQRSIRPLVVCSAYVKRTSAIPKMAIPISRATKNPPKKDDGTRGPPGGKSRSSERRVKIAAATTTAMAITKIMIDNRTFRAWSGPKVWRPKITSIAPASPRKTPTAPTVGIQLMTSPITSSIRPFFVLSIAVARAVS